MSSWTRCSDEMPISGLKVLAVFRNRSDKWRTVLAEYVPAYTYECVCSDWCGCETRSGDDDGEQRYWPEGWYEAVEEAEFEQLLPIDPTHWMPLPSPPSD